MSIQKLEFSNNVVGTATLDRRLDENSEKLVMDVLMITQYTHPEESAVRELTSNAVDANTMKYVAKDIITGKKKVSDYFIERDGEMYKDSKWDASYYDLDYLDFSRNYVELIYKEGEGNGYVDTFTVKDYGIGLGGNKLEGYFKLGYSDKRNTPHALGAFGLTCT